MVSETRLPEMDSRPSFASFQDPFVSGKYKTMPAVRIIQYTFSALEAWARGHKYSRETDETPHEFAAAISGINESISVDANALADLVCQSFYSSEPDVSRDRLQPLVQLWRQMTSNVAQD